MLRVALVLAALLVPLSQANAAPLVPQIDFRDTAFSTANLSHSLTSAVDGVGFTVSAWAENDAGELEEALIWWDEVDGLGIWGKEDDEIDAGELLRITFDSLIGISHLFLSDLFSAENWGGIVYDETGGISTDFGLSLGFSAGNLAGNWGNASNGEAVFDLGKSHPVTELFITVPKNLAGSQNFSLLGFIDPVPRLPIAPALPLFLVGLAGLALARRKLL